MVKKMLIDATHAEETRVVVVDGNKVEEFDFESENKRQLAGNIYLAKVTRVEPSLQAAFVEYGGNRHGFLAFSEIHPDYYQIPIADREALMAEEEAYADAQRELENSEDDEKPKLRALSGPSHAQSANSRDAIERQEVVESDTTGMETIDLDDQETETLFDDDKVAQAVEVAELESDAAVECDSEIGANVEEEMYDSPFEEDAAIDILASDVAGETDDKEVDDAEDTEEDERTSDASVKDNSIEDLAEIDDEFDLRPVLKPRPRRYKIQEVIKMRQILLVQVVKEERGNKGAALTTYLSLAGRYCVLMPNTARGGGISRKITNAADRKRLKEIAGSIEVPKGAGLIIRTAGAKRTKTEVKRDYEYLQRLWEQIRELTLKSIAPAKIYEEGDLIKRSIRDLYNREIDEVLVEGDRGYRIAKDFMKMIMPSHAKNVKSYQDPLPLFARYQVESYLGSMFSPVVQLKSGGYIVIGVTEALVAVDVNSGRATKEGSIEDTALKTNLEAADEVARQLRLRDLAGLIVIDFIDMDERRNNTAVEKRMKDRLKTDRARIQVGRISGFGLMEMSRQRLRPGMIEATTQACPHCHGTGLIRSEDSLALAILRQIEEEGVRKRSREILLKCPVSVANFLMNQKREHIVQIEQRYGMAVRVEGIMSLISPEYEIEKFKNASRFVPELKENVVSVDAILLNNDSGAVSEEEVKDLVKEEQQEGDETRPKKRRRRRRRRRGKGEVGQDASVDVDAIEHEDGLVSAKVHSVGASDSSEASDSETPSSIVVETSDSKSADMDVADAEADGSAVERAVADEATENATKKKAPPKRKPRSTLKSKEKETIVSDASGVNMGVSETSTDSDTKDLEHEAEGRGKNIEAEEEKTEKKRVPRKPRPAKSNEAKSRVTNEKRDKSKIEATKLEAAAEIGSTSEAAEPLDVVETIKIPEAENKPRRRGWWSRD